MSDRIMFTRREFLRTASVLAVGATIPRFLVEFASAAQTGVIPGFSDDRILVVVQLAGGNDGLNTVVPYADDAYYRARPTLAQPKEKLLRVDDHVAFHPKLAPLADLLQKQYLTIVEGVGYPNPNRSHFRSMEIWQTASDSREYLTTGWVGRYLDAACSGEAKPVAGVSIGGEMPLAMVGKRGLAVTVQDLESFGWKTAENTAPPEALLQLNHALSKNAEDAWSAHRTHELFRAGQSFLLASGYCRCSNQHGFTSAGVQPLRQFSDVSQRSVCAGTRHDLEDDSERSPNPHLLCLTHWVRHSFKPIGHTRALA
ncbi:MAG: hypothetical protein KatS3mg130_0164 [Candidatus Sumerlaea sp.]|nr:MAG: hypothetical protein KatS3mg130_0164 [Candidatus Sumerlaea sp.]